MTTPDDADVALERRQAQRLAAQLLSGPPADGTVEVARWLLAVQAQDPRGARLAVRARSRARSATDVEAALFMLTGAVLARGKYDRSSMPPGYVERVVDELLLGLAPR